jgi:hypothetical protein
MRCWIGVMLLVLLTFLTVGCRRHDSPDNTADKRQQAEPSRERGIENGEEAVRADERRRHTEAAGGFSFIPPEGWQIRDFPGKKFKIVVGPAAAGFAANINIVDESFDGSLEDYAKASLNALPKVLKKYRLLKQENFVTAAGLQGMRAIVEDEQNNRLLRQTFYTFSKKSTKFTLTCSALAEEGDEFAPVFEASMKTFRFDAP